MNKKNLYNDNLETVANYLISLYYKTGCKYSCERQKINKLLTIYKLCATKYGSRCFKYQFFVDDEHIGFSGFDIANLMNKDIYNSTKTGIEQENRKFINDIIDDSIKVPQLTPKLINIGFKITDISKEAKDLIEKIFRKFANYNVISLASMIEDLREAIPMIRYSDGSKDIAYWHYSNFLNHEEVNCAYADNEIFTFIKNFDFIDMKELSSNNNKVKKLKNSKIY